MKAESNLRRRYVLSDNNILALDPWYSRTDGPITVRGLLAGQGGELMSQSSSLATGSRPMSD